MNCDDALALIDALNDGELDAAHTQQVQGHLAHCPACQQAWKTAAALRAQLRALPRHSTPADLSGAVLAAIGTDASFRNLPRSVSAPKTAAPSWWGLFGLRINGLSALVACAFCLALGSLVTWQFADVEAQQTLQHQLVSAHLRALAIGRPAEVISTEQHTVKPWFNGKLNYAPMVLDLSAQEFPLVGGRLEVLEAQTVAVMVYRHREHRISVYEWPQAYRLNVGRGAANWRGLHTLAWRDQGMQYLAVSDVQADDLHRLMMAWLASPQDQVPER